MSATSGESWARCPPVRNASRPCAEPVISTRFRKNKKESERPVRSLFPKIFLWFWLAMALVSLTLILSSTWTQSRSSGERDEAIDRAMTPLIADNFAEVFDRQGKAGLEELLSHGKGSFPWEPYLFDSSRHEVLGRQVSPQITEAMHVAELSRKKEIIRGSPGHLVGQDVLTNSGCADVHVLDISRRRP